MNTESRAKKRSLLLTGAGGAAIAELLERLGKRGWKVVACDASGAVAAPLLVDSFEKVPFAAASEYKDRIADLLEVHEPEFVLPLVDEEILRFHELFEEDRVSTGTRLFSPRRSFCETFLDKWTTVQALGSIGVGVPRSALASESAGVGFPCVIKPRRGRGSRGFSILQSAAELEAYLVLARRPPEEFVVQELLTGVEYTTSVVAVQDGRALAVVPKRVVVKRGVTNCAYTEHVESIDRACRTIQEKLRADSPFNVQLMLGDDGVPRVFEVNPRLSTTVVLTMEAGVDELELAIQAMRGEKVAPVDFREGVLMLRSTRQHYTTLSSWSFDLA